MQDDKNFWHTVEFKISRAQNINDALNEEQLYTIAELTNAKGSEIFNDNENIYLRAHYNSNVDLDTLLDNINNTLKNFQDIKIHKHYEIKNQSWATQHIDAFPPLDVGKNLTVSAPWHEDKLNKNRTNLFIFPASAFGTGYHESTQIALTLLEECVKQGDKILDVGTGSGILSIAAVKLGAEHAYARDIDPAVIDEVKRNIELNKINFDKFTLEVADLAKNFDQRVNILTANILLPPNLELLPEIKNILENNGNAIFSGMTLNERDVFVDALIKNNFKIIRELKLNDWWGCQAAL